MKRSGTIGLLIFFTIIFIWFSIFILTFTNNGVLFAAGLIIYFLLVGYYLKGQKLLDRIPRGVKKIIKDVIEEEISNLEESGVKVKLRTLCRKRTIVTAVLGVIFAGLIVLDLLGPAFAILILYFIILYHMNNASVITGLARNSPDTPIADIIRGDLKS